MIERYLIRNELTLKRWRKFKSRRDSITATWIFLGMCFFSFTAEFWANSRPLVLFDQGTFYFPAFKSYHPTEFGRSDILMMDYKNHEFGADSWAVWPLVRWDPYENNKEAMSYPAPPSRDNWLGTDDRGRDVLARLLYGFRYSIGYAIGVWLLSYFLGVVVGALMGYAGGRFDLFGQRVVEVFESIPTFPMLLVLISIFNPNVFWLIAFSSIFGWMFISIYIRAEFLKLRKLEFVEAARALGGKERRIVFQHVLPNALGPLITFSPFTITSGVVALANLDFLGFGLQPPTPSWGELLQQAKNYFTVAWWLAVYTNLFMFITLVVLNLIGHGIRDAFDPRVSASER